MTVSTAAAAAGFADPVHDAQAAFRGLLDAMARPGQIAELDVDLAPPSPLHVASAAVLLALADFDTPLWLDPAAAGDEVTDFLRFHCGCLVAAEPAQAAFALIADPAAMPPLTAFAQGTDDYPDRAATLVVQVCDLAVDGGWQLRGPGIETTTSLKAAPLPADLVGQLGANHQRYPRGVDLVLTSGQRLAALPRSTRIGG